MGPPMTFNTGDAFEIYKLLVALDQPGRGKGDLLADKDPVVTGIMAAPGVGTSLRLGKHLQ